MKIKRYEFSDKEDCVKIFESNVPKFFDQSEHDEFIHWLDHQSGKIENAYNNTKEEAYFVIKNSQDIAIACAGYYVTKDLKEARFAWGMVHNAEHNKGLGTKLCLHRILEIQNKFPGMPITLGTSQHTYPFYEKIGFKVVEIIPKGYGESIDRYDMEYR